MEFPSGKPNHIEDYLCTVREGQWFGWSDSKNKIYANLIVHDGGSKPTEKECTDGLAALITDWNLQFDSYKSKRRDAFPSLAEQLDQLYHDINAGKFGSDAKTGEWFVGITSVKTANPKSS